MSGTQPTAIGERGRPDEISLATYHGLEGRVIRLEEYRKSHEEEHTRHIATHAWVYARAFAVAGLIATIAAAAGVALVRVLFGA